MVIETEFGKVHGGNFFIIILSCISQSALLGLGTISHGHGFIPQGTSLWSLRKRVGIPRGSHSQEEL